jgi:hypothetical protein
MLQDGTKLLTLFLTRNEQRADTYCGCLTAVSTSKPWLIKASDLLGETQLNSRMKLTVTVLLLALSRYACQVGAEKHQKCRNVPDSAGYPSAVAWNALNATISGRLVVAVPSAKYCASLPGGACTDEQWASSVFRNTIPGAMSQV